MKMLLRTSAVLDGRWTFQIVDEFNDLYYQPAISLVRKLRLFISTDSDTYQRHMKEERRTHGKLGHEALPAAIHPSPPSAGSGQSQLG